MGSPSNNILFIFEGSKAEPSIHEKIKEFFFPKNTIITCVFGTVIYAIYKDIQTDNDLDIFSLLKDRISELKDYNRTYFSEIYLFFDYDNHASNASDVKLKDLLEIFNDETENGKLYISYPMVEALKHFCNHNDFQNTSATCSEDYKKLVNDYCKNNNNNFIDFKTYTYDVWKSLISANLFKMNYIINDNYSFPTQIYSQLEIFENQKKKFINENNEVSVLSAFPIFIHDYFGNDGIRNLLKLSSLYYASQSFWQCHTWSFCPDHHDRSKCRPRGGLSSRGAS